VAVEYQNLEVFQEDRKHVRIAVAPASPLDAFDLRDATEIRWIVTDAAGTVLLEKTKTALEVSTPDAETVSFVISEAESAAIPVGRHTHACAIWVPGKHTVTRGRYESKARAA
jgi:hypothetical protein